MEQGVTRVEERGIQEQPLGIQCVHKLLKETCTLKLEGLGVIAKIYVAAFHLYRYAGLCHASVLASEPHSGGLVHPGLCLWSWNN